MKPQHPFKLLRKFLKAHEDLKAYSTQAGFAELLDCSHSLVSAIEQKKAKITASIAERIQRTTGVSKQWLAAPQFPNLPIPGDNGEDLSHERVIGLVSKERQRMVDRSGVDMLLDPKFLDENPDRDAVIAKENWRRISVAVAKLVEDSVYRELSNGGVGLLAEINSMIHRRVKLDSPSSTTPSSEVTQSQPKEKDLHE